MGQTINQFERMNEETLADKEKPAKLYENGIIDSDRESIREEN